MEKSRCHGLSTPRYVHRNFTTSRANLRERYRSVQRRPAATSAIAISSDNVAGCEKEAGEGGECGNRHRHARSTLALRLRCLFDPRFHKLCGLLLQVLSRALAVCKRRHLIAATPVRSLRSRAVLACQGFRGKTLKRLLIASLHRGSSCPVRCCLRRTSLPLGAWFQQRREVHAKRFKHQELMLKNCFLTIVRQERSRYSTFQSLPSSSSHWETKTKDECPERCWKPSSGKEAVGNQVHPRQR